MGDGLVNVCDIAKIRQYFAGQPFDPAVNEFQRADTADYNPAGNSGDGKLLANDLVQVRRYAGTLDPSQAAGGPTVQLPAPDPLDGAPQMDNGADSARETKRMMRVVSTTAEPGGHVVVSIEMDSQGDEVATSFDLTFDPAKLSNPFAELGTGVPADAVLTVNTTNVEGGQIGVLVDSGYAFGCGCSDGPDTGYFWILSRLAGP